MNDQYIKRLEKARDEAIRLALAADQPVTIHRAQGRAQAFQEAIDWATKDDPAARSPSKAFA